MRQPIARTASTSFSDTELLILDAAAMDGGLRSMYLQDRFSSQFNFPSHRLDDDSLNATLDRWERSGWITGEARTNRHGVADRTVWLTAAGGQLWESERKPDWSRYVADWYNPWRMGGERPRVSIFGHSASICKSFFRAGCQSGFFDYRGGKTACGKGRRQLIKWRRPQTVFLLSAWLERTDSPTDWSLLEMKRCWWRFPNEIAKFWDWPALNV